MENRDSNDNNATQTSQQTQQQQDQQLRQQQGQQDRQSQQGGQSPTGQDGQEGQTDTETKPDIDAEAKSGQPQSGQQGGQGSQGSQGGASSGFVGASTGDSSESYVTEDPSAKTDFAEQGQGATEGQDSSAGDSDITTGQPRKDDASLDDGAAGR